MANPIQLDFSPRNPQAELRQRLVEAPVEHAAALLELLELLDELHESKVLSTLRGAVGAGDSIVNQLAHAAAQPESVRAIRNLLALAKILGQIDPELIAAIQRSLPRTLKADDAGRPARAPSLWQIARTFWSPPVRRALMASGCVLAGIGLYLARDRRQN